MATDKNKGIVQLAVDYHKGVITQFNKSDTEKTLRAELNDILDLGNHKNFRRAMQANGRELFNVMEDVLDILIVEGLENQFDPFVDHKTVKIGDRSAFMIEDYHLFNVATIAAGTSNIRRQKMDRSALYIDTDYKGIKLYAELEEYLAGKVDFARMITKLNRSMNAQLAADISAAIVAGYGTLQSPYTYSGTWNLTEFNKLIQHVEAATGVKAMVLGNRASLQKVAPANLAYNGTIVEARNQLGFYTMIDGTTLYEIKQSHVPGTDNFAVGDYLIVVPQGEERIVKVVLEGDAQIEDNSSGENRNSDQSIEYFFEKKYGVGVITSTKYGVMLLS